MKKIVFTGGGTLGHIYPMLPVIKEIKEKHPNYKITFFGSKNGLEEKFLQNHASIDEMYFLDLAGLKRKLSFKNFQVIRKYFKARSEVKKIMQEIRPDIVIGMGGYVSAPVVKTASKLKIKTIIHEQNSYLGLANRLLIKNVDKLLLAFKLKKDYKNAQVIGNPRSSEVIKLSKTYPPKLNHQRTLLVVGGSRGANKINELTLKIIPYLKNLEIKTILITGNKYYQEHKERLDKLQSTHIEIIPFTNQLIEMIHTADVVISRSGATTLFELMALEKVCILIPSPNVTNNHQLSNAMYFKNKGCTFILEEKDLNSFTLTEMIRMLFEDELIRKSLISNMKKLDFASSSELFLNAIEELLNRK